MALYVKPFTELFEDVMEEMRESSSEAVVEAKYKRRVNQVYQFDIPSRYEWDWLRRAGTVNTYTSYQTGTVAVTQSSSAVALTSGTWSTASAFNKIKLSSDDHVYAVASGYASTSCTISPTFYGSTVTADGYTIYRDLYTLPADFGRFPVRGPKLYHYTNGQKREIKWMSDAEFMKRSTVTPTDYPLGWRVYPGKTSLGLYQIELSSPISDSLQLHVEYVKAQDAMYEVAATSASSGHTTVKTITTADISAQISAGDYIRSDVASQWAQVTSVSSTTINHDALRAAVGNSVAVTVSKAPDMPYEFNDAIFYGACMLTAAEQNDPAMQGYVNAYSNALDMGMGTQNRKRFGKRRMNLGNWR